MPGRLHNTFQARLVASNTLLRHRELQQQHQAAAATASKAGGDPGRRALHKNYRAKPRRSKHPGTAPVQAARPSAAERQGPPRLSNTLYTPGELVDCPGPVSTQQPLHTTFHPLPSPRPSIIGTTAALAIMQQVAASGVSDCLATPAPMLLQHCKDQGQFVRPAPVGCLECAKQQQRRELHAHLTAMTPPSVHYLKILNSRWSVVLVLSTSTVSTQQTALALAAPAPKEFSQQAG